MMFNVNSPAKRNEWSFQFPVADVLDGVQRRLEFFEGRLRFWRTTKEEVIEKIKAGGISFDDSLAADVTNNAKFSAASNVAYGRQTTVSIDEKLEADLNECNGKIMSHSANVVAFKSWQEFLSASPANATVELKHGDYMYFFGAIAPEESK